MACDLPPILALSAADIAQITSSRVVSDLNAVVCGLLVNALEAKAKRIRVTVNYASGSCQVEDDGCGIAASDFAEDGGLLKAYYSSKHGDGGHGVFLSSLAAISELTITSRREGQEAPSAIICKFAESVLRLAPAPSNHNLTVGAVGTRVTARNLFGNMPVRVKQRDLQSNTPQSLRSWHNLIHEVLHHLLAWNTSVSVTLREESLPRQLDYCGESGLTLSDGKTKPTFKSRGFRTYERNLQYLKQSGFLSRDIQSFWTPVCASMTGATIKGAISLTPAPSREVQFLSSRSRPMYKDSASSELYQEINRVFANSCFGVVEEDVDCAQVLAKTSDKRYKVDGPTDQQRTRSSKGVDRWPMFFLNLESKSEHCAIHSRTGEQKAEQCADIRAVMQLLGTMVTAWLKDNHFRPITYRHSHRPRGTSKNETQQANDELRSHGSGASDSSARLLPNHAWVTEEAPANGSMAKAVSPSSQSALSTLSRIKRGRPATPQDAKEPVHSHDGQVRQKPAMLISKEASNQVAFSPEVDVQPAINTQAQKAEAAGLTVSVPSGSNTDAVVEELVAWTDPVTSQRHFLNPRSGVSYATQYSGGVDNPLATEGQVLKAIRARNARQQTAENLEATSNPWIKDLLQAWQNPVFHSPERGIACTSQSFEAGDSASKHKCHSHFSFPFFGAKFDLSTQRLNKYLDSSKLQMASVIAQVDRKFILVEVPTITPSKGDESRLPSGILMLFDQHAIDERIQVERLFEEFCTSPTQEQKSPMGHLTTVRTMNVQKPISFTTTPRECELLNNQADVFAKWGIFYAICTAKPEEDGNGISSNKHEHCVTITALPPVIIERCTANPDLIISVLRTEVWARASASRTTSTSRLLITTGHDQHKPKWYQQITDCPRGIIDMIHSRACRSAIMFNDELSKDQCQDLLTRLANCAFPFMCAHGRPSFAPLLALRSLDGHGAEQVRGDEVDGETGKMGFWPAHAGAERGGGLGKPDERGFVEAFRAWKGMINKPVCSG